MTDREQQAIEAAAVAIFHNNEGESVDQWGDLYQREREAYMEQARAAIAAYREATGVERDAERYRWLRDKRISGGYLPCLASYSDMNGILPVLRECWQSGADVDAAIDSARGGEHG